MALPSSGQIAFSDVRTEMSQSATSTYAFGGWTSGNYGNNFSNDYAPINILSSGSRWSTSTTYGRPISMSQWYSYNHTANLTSSVTGTLFEHINAGDIRDPSTMLLIDAGTSNTTWSINVSGSLDSTYDAFVKVYYGRPWTNTGADSTGSAIYITGSVANDTSINLSFNYNYTYDSSRGQYLYFVLYGGGPTS